MAIIYKFAPGWDGSNHESNVDKAEVERLTKAGVDLLVRNFPTIHANRTKRASRSFSSWPRASATPATKAKAGR
jgi:hypothetical protein